MQLIERYKSAFTWSGLIIGLIAVLYLVTVPFSASTDNLKKRQLDIAREIEKNLSAGVYRDEKNVQVLSEEIKYVEAKLAQIKGQVNFKSGLEYQLPAAKQEWLITLQAKARALQKKMEKIAADKGVQIPNSIEIPSDIQSDAIPLYFEKLDMMEQLMNYAIESDVDEVAAIGLSAVLSDFGSTSSGGKPVNPADAANIVSIKVSGSFKSISKFIYRLTSATRLLCLEKAVLETAKPELDKVTITIAVSAVKVKDDNQTK
ncbi:MAG: hypothetical protein WC980_02910 [Candidatus Brocadiia bacterium]